MRTIEFNFQSVAFEDFSISRNSLSVPAFVLAAVTVILGIAVFRSRILALAPLVLFPGYLSLGLAVVCQTSESKDPFNPLTVLLSLAVLRFGFPYLLLYLGASRPYAARNLISLLGLTETHLILGHILWITAINALVLGWFFVPRAASGIGNGVTFSTGIWVVGSAAVLFFLGTASIGIYIHLNADLFQVIKNGSFRSQQIIEGTGKFWYFGLSTISAAAVLCSTVLSRYQGRFYFGILPGIVAMSIFWVLGGRSRALTPAFICVMLCWYWWSSRSDRTIRPFRILALLGCLIFVLAWFLHLSNIYQRGFGPGSLPRSFATYPEYLWRAVYADIGNFQGIAGSVAVGGGQLGGKTFGVFLFPLSELLPVGKSTGVYIVETLVGRDSFGVGPSLIGDAYVNFGLLGTLVVLGVFGLCLRLLYRAFVRRKIRPVVYAAVTVYAIRIMFEAVNKWVELVVVFGFTVAVLAVTVKAGAELNDSKDPKDPAD